MTYDWITQLEKRNKTILLDAIKSNSEYITNLLKRGLPVSIEKNGFVITFLCSDDIIKVNDLLIAK